MDSSRLSIVIQNTMDVHTYGHKLRVQKRRLVFYYRITNFKITWPWANILNIFSMNFFPNTFIKLQCTSINWNLELNCLIKMVVRHFRICIATWHNRLIWCCLTVKYTSKVRDILKYRVLRKSPMTIRNLCPTPQLNICNLVLVLLFLSYMADTDPLKVIYQINVANYWALLRNVYIMVIASVIRLFGGLSTD